MALLQPTNMHALPHEGPIWTTFNGAAAASGKGGGRRQSHGDEECACAAEKHGKLVVQKEATQAVVLHVESNINAHGPAPVAGSPRGEPAAGHTPQGVEGAVRDEQHPAEGSIGQDPVHDAEEDSADDTCVVKDAHKGGAAGPAGTEPGHTEPPLPAATENKSKVWWYVVMVLVHCGWGILPVNARYLQTKARPPLGAFRLGFYIAAFASLALLTLQYIPAWTKQVWNACKLRRTAATGQVHSTCSPAIPKGRLLEWLASITILSIALGALAFGQIYATSYTSGNWVQLISITVPLFVALLASVVLGAHVPRSLYPTLVGVLLGAALVIYGGIRASGDGMAIRHRDFIGFAIAIIATLAMAVFYVVVQKTEGLVGEDQVLLCEYAVMCVLLAPMSALLEEPDWNALLHHNWVFWGHILFASLAVYYGCNLVQQFVIRNVGANVYSMAAAVRLVASIAASWLLLGERITSWMQWLGCFLVVTCISAYLYIQVYWPNNDKVEGALWGPHRPDKAPVAGPLRSAVSGLPRHHSHASNLSWSSCSSATYHLTPRPVPRGNSIRNPVFDWAPGTPSSSGAPPPC